MNDPTHAPAPAEPDAFACAAEPGSAPRQRPTWSQMLALRWIRALLLVELVAVLIVGTGLWTLRRQTLEGELRSLAALAAAMAAQGDGTLETADAALRATRDELVNGLLVPGQERSTAVLRARAAALPGYQALVIHDQDGHLLASSRQIARENLDVSARDFFEVAAQDRVGGLYVGSPADTAQGSVIGVSLPWRGHDGRFRGVVALLAPAQFLDGEFERIAPTRDTALAIYRRGHGLVSDGPGSDTSHVLPPALQAMVWSPADAARAQTIALPSGRKLLMASHGLARHPLAVVITRDAGMALAEWSEQAWLVGSFASSALLVTLVLALRAGREQLRRHAAEAELAQEQQRALRAFQAAEEGHWEWDPRHRVSHLSPRMRELMGLPRSAGMSAEPALMVPATVHPDDLPALAAAFAAHEAGRTATFDCTFRVRTGSGEATQWRHVRSRGLAWRDAAGVPLRFAGTAMDVSDEVRAREERQQLQDQLQRARQLEALGTLAGGVAHDFNNILAAVLGYGELARDAAPQGSAQARQLDQVLQAGQRGQALVARILAFSRGARRGRDRVRAQPVVEEVLQLLAARLPTTIRLETDLQAPQACLIGDATAFYEAVMNLATNAIQAMPAGGELKVSMQERDIAQAHTAFSGELRAGRHLVLAVRDSGLGMSTAVMARLFEPFFTTKGPGDGTGLGLAVVRAVVRDLEGAIDVASTPGQGSCFTLYLPCTQDTEDGTAPPAGTAGAATPDLPLGQGEQVLVVDDDPALVELTEDMLASLGYEPWGLLSGTEALQRLREEPQRFDLLLSDERMPGLSGTELAAAARALCPALPVVIASGWGGPELQTRAAAAGVALVLDKPLQRAELARALARVLRREEG